MAMIISFYCNTCYEYVQECRPSGLGILNECTKCKNKKTQSDRATFLKGLEALTLEERIARIEAWIYDYKLAKSISEITF